MENRNFKNDIFIKNKNLRDYDKEPIELYDYEVLHNAAILLVPFLFGVSIPTNINAIFDNEDIIDIIFVNAIIFGMVLLIFLAIFIFNKPSKNKILIKNSVVEFYEKTIFFNNSELKRIVELKDIKENIYKPFTVYSIRNENYKVKFGIFAICALIMSISMSFLWFLGFLIFGLFGFILANFILYIIIGKKGDRFFTIFPKIALSEPYFIPYSAGNFLPQYYSLIICNRSKYSEVKEYFLNLYNINIDNVEKIYF
ncbi:MULTISPECIES: hypothetical protein [unclassified Campylobacter]|uniref:hypothetical protein n=1 Tax=unclassified Campylobacter TaxID=2593542 RepID=UPI0022EA05D8|nr:MULTISPECIES: hypothetical protein [unclassified Campylobacter]MDA3043271.1 hypothetical protein [Campylobacter sp. JMF_09 ED2]MDA3045040.1 hypothetical protein [Campylobacter sp. JMF_07 ED4]MDA3064360.1 hypothetical protein [Campylobacter sp. JMF_11 EL3]MDA3071823.1 hypothetical protein [Campylobacter sp. VBCF_03 NA9]MDA3075243.1 hypothetical protein [Campylobacter sp. JMF_05 ED3]